MTFAYFVRMIVNEYEFGKMYMYVTFFNVHVVIRYENRV